MIIPSYIISLSRNVPVKIAPSLIGKRAFRSSRANCFEVLEPCGKFRDNAPKPVHIHMAKFRVGNLCIRSCIPSPQSACCQGPCPLPGLPLIHVNMTITNAHPYKDIEKRLEIVPISVAVAVHLFPWAVNRPVDMTPCTKGVISHPLSTRKRAEESRSALFSMTRCQMASGGVTIGSSRSSFILERRSETQPRYTNAAKRR